MADSNQQRQASIDKLFPACWECVNRSNKCSNTTDHTGFPCDDCELHDIAEDCTCAEKDDPRSMPGHEEVSEDVSTLRLRGDKPIKEVNRSSPEASTTAKVVTTESGLGDAAHKPNVPLGLDSLSSWASTSRNDGAQRLRRLLGRPATHYPGIERMQQHREAKATADFSEQTDDGEEGVVSKKKDHNAQ